MSNRVCVIAPDHADALENRGVIPDCAQHDHITHWLADRLIGALEDGAEGYGRARTVYTPVDRRRRITRVADVLTYASRKSGFDGPQVQQAIMAELR